VPPIFCEDDTIYSCSILMFGELGIIGLFDDLEMISEWRAKLLSLCLERMCIEKEDLKAEKSV